MPADAVSQKRRRKEGKKRRESGFEWLICDRADSDKGNAMKGLRYVYAGAVLGALVLTLGLWNPFPEAAKAAPGGGQVAPTFRVDPTWPKPLPNNWQIGQVPGIAVDQDDNIWIVQRPRTLTSDERGASAFEPGTGGALDGAARPQGSISDCCLPAPSVMQFDRKGNLLRAWGGPVDPGRCVEPDCEWPVTEHGIFVDHNMNVWLGGQGGRAVLKFSADGTFLLQIGRRVPPVAESNRTDGGVNGTPLLGQPADLEVDPETNELYVADGYTNKRVIVFDAETGAYRRHWGAYGNVPEDVQLTFDPGSEPPRQFVGPVHGIDLSRDGFLYVSDRSANRIQVFERDGTFVREAFVARETQDLGSAYGVALSPDPEQAWVFVNDGSNNVIWILGRSDLEVVGSFSSYGRQGGQVMSAHSIAVDGQGNVYVGETRGRRVQRFLREDGSP